jgi:hypothetical protein
MDLRFALQNPLGPFPKLLDHCEREDTLVASRDGMSGLWPTCDIVGRTGRETLLEG